VLVRSDHVGHLTEAGRQALVAYGVTTVIDLRSPAELEAAPNPFSPLPIGERARERGVNQERMKYIHLPVVDDANMRRLGDATNMFDRYLMMLGNRSDAFRQIFTAVADASGGIVFHCFAGKDRTGLVAAMLLEVAGVSDDAIAEDFAETDVQLAKKYEQWLAEAEPQRREALSDELHCPPERILSVLDHLRERWGGVAGYLEAAGLPAEKIDQLSSKLT
jgi:protein-tyrosine phosphatase